MARPKQKAINPISAAVQEWLAQSHPDLSNAEPTKAEFQAEALVAEAPKRWVIYEPMVLLPSGSFTTPRWREILAKVSEGSEHDLWRRILHNIGAKMPGKTTHLAVNDGIPLTLAAPPSEPEDTCSTGLQQDKENVLRSPIGLRTLYGDFGPETIARSAVSEEDYDNAFWACTKQNGIHQTWAPRWTMFSRGNVKEKARLLAFHESPPPPPPKTKTPTTPPGAPHLPHRVRSRAAAQGTGTTATWAVDLYAGIGYFVFSYARLGMRVLCWELNPWSVEGLRRGARANGWSVRVVRAPEELARPTGEVVAGGDAAIVVFLEDNRHAARRVAELRAAGLDLPVVHVNCGLLPRSDDSWGAARAILGEGEGEGEGRAGWLHLHENVGFKDIGRRRSEIQGLFDEWDRGGEDQHAERTAEVEHVELVKTFAPDVWHCVFDVYITRSSRENHESR